MPEFGSRAPGFGRTWCRWRRVGGGVELQRAETAACWSRPSISPNKAFVPLLAGPISLHLHILLAGHGGGGEDVGCGVPCDRQGGWSAAPALVLRRGTKWVLKDGSIRLLWKKKMGCPEGVLLE